MAVNSVDNTKTAIQKVLEQSSKKTEDRKVGEMGKNEFLNLMMTQLKYQDPMNPMQDKEFIGQMAQFSSLEQMQNLNTSFASVKGINYLGRTVKATVTDSLTKETKDVNGVVSDVKMSKDGVVAVVDGMEVPVEKVTGISDQSLANTTQDVSKYTGFIGFKVKGTYTDSDNNNLGITGYVKEVSKGEKHEEAVLDGAEINIVNVSTPTRLTTPEEKKAYLDSNIGKEITVTAADDTNSYSMKLTGKLNSYVVGSDGKIKVNLDNMKIPVKSISSVMDARY